RSSEESCAPVSAPARAPSAPTRRRRRPRRSILGLPSAAPSGAVLRHRQPQLKDRAARLARKLDQAAVAGDEILRNGEPESRAGRSAGHERIKDRLLQIVRYAGPAVLDLER